ncbi:N-acetyltransferase [Allostella sp. ATCC 35155]|nr:N-acetyltransferase [Stella sp. ATCC 35155]
MTAAGDVELRILRRPPPELRARLDRRLAEFNRRRVGRSEARLFGAVYVDAATEREIAGLYAQSYWGWMCVDELWVDARRRGRGLGRRLMEAAEEEAVARGCRGMWVDTWSWQARGFYEKLGFEVFGAIEDFPPPHGRFFLKKRLDGG